MRAAPPAGGVGRIATVAGPGVSLVILQHIVFADVLRKTAGLEHAHVFARGENIRAVQCVIDADDEAGGEFAFIKLAGGELGVQRGDEVAPDHGFVRDARVAARGDFGQVDDVEMVFDFLFAGGLGLRRVIKYMERIVVGVLRVNAVAREAAAQPVRAVMHGADGGDDALPGFPCPVLVEDTGDRAAGRDADLTFFLQHWCFLLMLPGVPGSLSRKG